MKRNTLIPSVLILASAAVACAQTVTVSLESPQRGQTVEPASVIEWEITVSVSTGDNEGLALFHTDLVQSPNNPATLDLSPAGGVPAELANFARPLGISNPGPNGTDGYVGLVQGSDGARNLVQIGGGQNSFGQAMPVGTGVGESAEVVTGVGHAAPVTIASGTFVVPSTAGTYTFTLENVQANVLTAIGAVDAVSRAASATLVDAEPLTFEVQTEAVPGDMNCDGAVSVGDINPFVLALTNPTGYADQFPDCNLLNGDCTEDGTLTVGDINCFVELVTNG